MLFENLLVCQMWVWIIRNNGIGVIQSIIKYTILSKNVADSAVFVLNCCYKQYDI